MNIRELAQFVEIVKLKIYKDKFNRPCKLKWTIRRIENSSLFDRYMASGKKDKECYKEETVIANYNVFNLYDSQSCKPKFYAGHFDEDFDINESEPTENSLEGYIKYLQDNDDELPDGYYQSKTVKRRKDND